MNDTPTVDTFEHDIVEEIRHKETSISEIASASNDINNIAAGDGDVKKTNPLLVVVLILTVCGVIGGGYLGYSYLTADPAILTSEQEKAITQQKKKLEPTLQLSNVSKTLTETVGAFLGNAEKTKDGYIIPVASYSPVFSYMIKHEKDFGDEIAVAVGNKHTTPKIENASTTKEITSATGTPSVGTSTTSTTTLAVATTTKIIKATSTPPHTVTATSTATTTSIQTLPTDYVFSDVTISNQNMRVATSIYGTVVYAFIGTQKLVISSSTDGILSLRSKALQK